MSITSGGMGRSVGQAFADAGFGGTFSPRDQPHYGGKPYLHDPRYGVPRSDATRGSGVLRGPFHRPGMALPDYNAPRGPSFRPPSTRDRNERFPSDTERDRPSNFRVTPASFSSQGTRAFGLNRNAPKARQGSGDGGNSGGYVNPNRPGPGPKLARAEHKLPTFRNAAGKKVPAKRVAAKAITNLVTGKKLTRNQNIVVGKALKNMNANQRRNFGTEIAMHKGPGQNVTHVRNTLAKPLGKALKVAKNHRKQVQAAKKNPRLAAPSGRR